jgi:nucleoside 2-deoxyribosyltransferase
MFKPNTQIKLTVNHPDMKNIYFAGSIRGGRKDAEIYRELIDDLKKYGAVLTEHIGSDEVSFDLSDRHIHDRDMDWLTNADILVAEVSTPSLGVGYEIGRAVATGKPVVCLYRKTNNSLLSAMIAGSPSLDVHEYSSVKEAAEIFSKLFGED